MPDKARGRTGRPTVYDPAFVEKVHAYLRENQDEWSEFHKTRGEKSDSYEPVVKVKLPTVEGFARFIGVHKDTLYEWKCLYPDFSDALDKIVEEQRDRLINEGLAGNYNPLIAKLVLSANHGMGEKTETKSRISVDEIIRAQESSSAGRSQPGA